MTEVYDVQSARGGDGKHLVQMITDQGENAIDSETLAGVDKEFCRNVRTVLTGLPSNYQKLPLTKGRSISEAIEIGAIKQLQTMRTGVQKGPR